MKRGARPGFDDRHGRRARAVDCLAGHSGHSAVCDDARVPSRATSHTRRRCRAAAAARNLRRRRAGSSRADSRRRRARARREATRRQPNSRPSITGCDDIPNPRAGPTPRANAGRGPVVGAGPAAATLVAASVGDGGAAIDGLATVTLPPSGGDAVSAGAATFASGAARRLRQKLNLHGERKAHRAHQARAVGGHRRERLLAGPFAARVAPLDASVDGPVPRLDADQHLLGRGLRRRGRIPVGR